MIWLVIGATGIIFASLIVLIGAVYFKRKLTIRDANEAIKYVQARFLKDKANKKNRIYQLNLLGEHYNGKSTAFAEYLLLIEKILSAKLDSICWLSIKLSQFNPNDANGLNCLLRHAREARVKVCFDREGRQYDQLYEKMTAMFVAKFPEIVRPCIQVGRWQADEESEKWKSFFPRICRGAYLKEREIKDEKTLTNRLAEISNKILAGGYKAEVASHDPLVIKNLDNGVMKSMLRGLETEEADSIYVPIGSFRKALPYSWRRFREMGFRGVVKFLWRSL